MPKNVKADKIKLIKEYVTDQQGIFLHPTNEDSEEVLQFDKNGMLQLVPVEGDAEGEHPQDPPCHKTHNLIGEHT